MITFRWTLNQPGCQSACAVAKVCARFLCRSFSCAISYRRLALPWIIIRDIPIYDYHIFLWAYALYMVIDET